jgi:hypothetical protein
VLQETGVQTKTSKNLLQEDLAATRIPSRNVSALVSALGNLIEYSTALLLADATRLMPWWELPGLRINALNMEIQIFRNCGGGRPNQ